MTLDAAAARLLDLIYCAEHGELRTYLDAHDIEALKVAVQALEGPQAGVLSKWVRVHREDIEAGINDFGDLRPVLRWLDDPDS